MSLERFRMSSLADKLAKGEEKADVKPVKKVKKSVKVEKVKGVKKHK